MWDASAMYESKVAFLPHFIELIWNGRSATYQACLEYSWNSRKSTPLGHKKASVTGADQLWEWFSQAATRGVGNRWLLKGAC